jgi:hypothetical protein
MTWTWLGLGIACLVVWGALWLEHWFEWPRWLGKELEAPWTYIAGVAVLVVAYSIWAIAVHVTSKTAIIGLWAIVVTGGLAVLAAYGLDWLGGVLREWRTSRGKVGRNEGNGPSADSTR